VAICSSGMSRHSTVMYSWSIPRSASMTARIGPCLAGETASAIGARGSGQPQVVRMHEREVAAIDAWIAVHKVEIGRPDAIRRLVELGLRLKTK
jgi:hypothetical protein